jgi:hypothetical protein
MNIFPLLNDNDLKNTPSNEDGIESDVEAEQRIYSCELIQKAGILLKLFFYEFNSI